MHALAAVATGLVCGAIGALGVHAVLTPKSLAQRVKESTGAAVLQRKQAIVDCMAYTAAKVVEIERADRATDEACESLAGDFASTLARPEPTPAAPADSGAGELSL